MTESSRLLVPMVLTAVLPGLGHFALRVWKRGAVWIVVYLFAITFLSGYSPWAADMPRPFLVSLLGVQLNPIDVVFPLAVIVICLAEVYIISEHGYPIEPSTGADA